MTGTMRNTALYLCAWLICAAAAPSVYAAAAPAAPPPQPPPVHSDKHTPEWFDAAAAQKWTGDLDGMVKKRFIRALVVYSPTYYFVDKGTPRGLSYEALTLFEKDLNKALKTKGIPVHIVFIPVRRDQLIPKLLEGQGDIAASGITITAARDKLIDFSDPIYSNVNEIVVSGPASPVLASIDDLSGKEVFVRASSSFYEHLQALNAGFQKAGKAPVKLNLAPESMEDEDLLQMLNAGLVQFVVVDDTITPLWAQVLPKITPHPDLIVNAGGSYAWMIREHSPLLMEQINAFMKRHGKKSDSTRAEILRKYLKSTKYVKNSTSAAELQRFNTTVDLFRKYGDKYSFDALLMIAQGYQESRLDQQVKSPVGAIGVMQLMPATGKQMGVGDVGNLEPNVHAGIKYIASLRDQYFADFPMDDLNKALFSFAAYNAGPNRILRLRSLAEKRGLDPNLWFGNVEVVVSEKIGRETVTYVSNIFKYYIAYRLLLDKKLERDNAIKATQQKQTAPEATKK
jgi:membrane-bound lytic murein transglycosylase MltF